MPDLPVYESWFVDLVYGAEVLRNGRYYGPVLALREPADAGVLKEDGGALSYGDRRRACDGDTIDVRDDMNSFLITSRECGV